jgi:hypothetical protein
MRYAIGSGQICFEPIFRKGTINKRLRADQKSRVDYIKLK